MSDQFLAINLILGYIFENKTQKQKRQIVSDKIQSNKTKCVHLKCQAKNVFLSNDKRTVDCFLRSICPYTCGMYGTVYI